MRALLLIALTVLPTPPVFAETPTAPVPVYGDKGYVWNEMTPERVEVLRKASDATRGYVAYRGCRGCHKPEAAGRVDGSYPKLAGQYASVIIKQLVDIRSGARLNPKMAPFISPDAITVAGIADIATYLSTLTTTKENGKGPGDQVRQGEAIYTQRGCNNCHGNKGEGNGEKLYPALAGQHYSYLLREMELIKVGARGNSHPEMVTALIEIPPADMEALADYLARLPDRHLAEANAGKK